MSLVLNFLSEIKYIRKSLGFTKKDMADKMGVSYSQYKRLESGTAVWSIERIEKVSKVLNCEARIYLYKLNPI